MTKMIESLITKYQDVISGLQIEAVETEYSDDAEKCSVEINTLENVIHDLKALLSVSQHETPKVGTNKQAKEFCVCGNPSGKYNLNILDVYSGMECSDCEKQIRNG